MLKQKTEKHNLENMKLRSNLWKLRILQGIRFSLIAMPIIVIFLKTNGLSYFEIFLTQVFFSAAIIISEIPCGYFADRFGRKTALVTGSIILPVSVALIAFWQTFAGFALAAIFTGIAFSFFSGNESALLYDTLRILKEEEDYKKQEGLVQYYGRSFEAGAAIIGGLLAAIFISLPVYAWFVVTLAAFPVAVTLIEAKSSDINRNPHQFTNKIFEDLKRVWSLSLVENKTIRWTFIYSAVLSLTTLTSVWLFQPYFHELKVPLYLFGIGWALLNLSTALFAKQAFIIEQKMGQILVFSIMPIVLCIATLFFFIFNTPVIFIFALAIQAIRGIKMPLVFGILNEKTNSEVRASVLSVDGMLSRLFFIIIAPFVGLCCDYVSINSSFIILSVIVICLGVLSVIKMVQYQAFD
jgi:MFS family permease